MVTAVVPVCGAGDSLEVVASWLPKTGLANGAVAELSAKEVAADVDAGVDVAGWPKNVVPVVFATGTTITIGEDPCPNTASVRATDAAAPGSFGTDGD